MNIILNSSNLLHTRMDHISLKNYSSCTSDKQIKSPALSASVAVSTSVLHKLNNHQRKKNCTRADISLQKQDVICTFFTYSLMNHE